MKNKAKKKIAHNNVERRKTGGGPSTIQALDQTEEILANMIPPVAARGLESINETNIIVSIDNILLLFLLPGPFALSNRWIMTFCTYSHQFFTICIPDSRLFQYRKWIFHG